MTDHSDLIRRLVIPMVRERSREPGDAWHQAEQALSSQSLSLSEAREEIERLRAALGKVEHWAESRCPCSNEEPNPCPLCGASVENLEACKSAENTLPRDLLETIRSARRRARSQALENGPARLADATNNPADLSSLRKGAEDMREALRKIAFLRPAGPTRNKLAMQMERIAIDALGGPGEAARSALVSGSREEQS